MVRHKLRWNGGSHYYKVGRERENTGKVRGARFVLVDVRCAGTVCKLFPAMASGR